MIMLTKAACFLLVLVCRQWIVEGGTPKQIAQLLRDYDPSTPPNDGGKPTELKLGVYINGLYDVNAKNMDFSMNMYLRESWTDPRLAFNDTNAPKIRLDPSEVKIWVPDMFFRNAKQVEHIQVPTDTTLYKLAQDGNVWFVRQMAGTFSCPMRLHKFPFDSQSCPLIFESFGYTSDVLTFAWLDRAVDIDPGIQLSEFSLSDMILYDCSQNYTAGSFPCLEVRLILKRDVGYYVLQLFLPSILTVAISWVGFWLHTNAIAARTLVGLMTLLILTMQSGWARASIPPVSYVTAVDIWVIICFIFIALTLLELAVVNLLSGGQGDNEIEKGKMEGEGASSSKLDLFSRIGFPLVFGLFVVAYFAFFAA